MLNNKPDGKITIKISATYNKDCEADYTFNSLMELMNNNSGLIEKIIKEKEPENVRN